MNYARAMAGILVCLIFIYTRLEIGLIEVSKKKLYMVHTTARAGWITVATIANVAALLVANGWDWYNLTAVYVTAVMILVALVLTLVNTYVRGDVAYAAVLVWALGGIVQKQMSTWLIPYVA